MGKIVMLLSLLFVGSASFGFVHMLQEKLEYKNITAGTVQKANCNPWTGDPNVEINDGQKIVTLTTTAYKCLMLEDKLNEAADVRYCNTGRVYVDLEYSQYGDYRTITKISKVENAAGGHCR